ncbi:unnamed protein product [Schistosoma curassoni]|uniref:FERM domain-containing protein n=1 Tax=Schistosoma curassoni TaxID=6186 RepID=A0A183K6C3_9TREM|nr:unnamed protein product [Schistosoma curassoni]
MSQNDAEISFLKNVKKLSFYGVELHPIKKFHASYVSSGSFKNITKKLANSFSTRSRTSSVESYHNFIDTSSIGSNQLLNLNSTHNSLSISGLKSSLRRMFSVKSQAVNGSSYLYLFLFQQIKSSSSPRILLKCKFAFQKLARRFYKACVEHHMFFKIHCKRLLNSNINKRESYKPEPIVLPVNHTLHVNNELLNPSVSINGPCSIKLLSMSNLQSPKLPVTPTRSEFELDHLHSSNPQLNNCQFPEHSTERVHTPQTDSKSRTDMDSLKKTYSNDHLLLPCTSNELSTRSASFNHLDNYSVAHIPSPIECSSRLDILNSSVNEDNIDDRCRSANIPSYDCLQILDDQNSNPFDCLCRITSTQNDIHSSFNINDNPIIDSVPTYSENPSFKPSIDDTCQPLLACEIPNLLPTFIPINCALTNPMEEYLPTDILHCLSPSQHISSDFSQIELMRPTDSLWCCNLLSSVDLNSLNKIIAPSYSSVISSNGEIIRLDPSTNNNISKSSMSSLVPCDFFRWNSIEKQVNNTIEEREVDLS